MKIRLIVYTAVATAVTIALIAIGQSALNLGQDNKNLLTGCALFAMAVCSPILLWGRSRQTEKKESEES